MRVRVRAMQPTVLVGGKRVEGAARHGAHLDRLQAGDPQRCLLALLVAVAQPAALPRTPGEERAWLGLGLGLG